MLEPAKRAASRLSQGTGLPARSTSGTCFLLCYSISVSQARRQRRPRLRRSAVQPARPGQKAYSALARLAIFSRDQEEAVLLAEIFTPEERQPWSLRCALGSMHPWRPPRSPIGFCSPMGGQPSMKSSLTGIREDKSRVRCLVTKPGRNSNTKNVGTAH